jgi:hypothetical protein
VTERLEPRTSEEIFSVHRERVAAMREVEATPLEIPPPEVPARVIDWKDKDAWPMGPRSIGNRAERGGFTAVGSHSRGPWIGDVPLRVLRICDSLLLRMSHPDGRRAVALWSTHGDDWKIEFAYVISPKGMRPVKFDALKAYLDTEEPTTAPGEPAVDLTTFDVP